LFLLIALQSLCTTLCVVAIHLFEQALAVGGEVAPAISILSLSVGGVVET
jgi:hypothetical protein